MNSRHSFQSVQSRVGTPPESCLDHLFLSQNKLIIQLQSHRSFIIYGKVHLMNSVKATSSVPVKDVLLSMDNPWMLADNKYWCQLPQVRVYIILIPEILG